MPTIKKSLLVTLEFPPQHGGVGTYYANICKALPSEKIVVLAPEVNNSSEYDSQNTYPIIRHKLLNKLLQPRLPIIAPITSWILKRKLQQVITQLCKQHRIAFLHAGHILPLGEVLHAIWKKTKIPYCVYLHGLDILRTQKSVIKARKAQIILENALAIFTNSNFTKNQIIKLGIDSEDIDVIYPTPTHELTDPDQATIDSIQGTLGKKQPNIILGVGRLVRRKGFDLAIKALPHVLKRFPNTVLVLVGDGPYKQELQKLVGMHRLGEHVVFAGSVTEDELRAWHHVADIFVMPSRHEDDDVEGFGIVYLDANLAQTPVIGTHTGGIPEAIQHGHSGLLIESENLNQLVDAITSLLADKSYAQRLGFQGMERVLTKFDIEKQIDTLKNLLYE